MLNPQHLKQTARENLPGNHKRLALIHTAAALGVSLVVTLLHYYLNTQIGNTGGLSGLGTRTVLETAQTVLQYVINLALPFWEMGFLFAALQMARGQKAEVTSFWEGFRRFGPVLRLYLIRSLLFIGVGVASAYVSAFIFAASPMAKPLMELLLPMMESGADVVQMQDMLLTMSMEELIQYFWPFLVMAGILFAVLAAFLLYKFRVADYLAVDKGLGGLGAMIGSSRITKGHRLQLLKLDLSFWWFYLLVAVSSLVMNADVLLQQLGVALPASGDAMWLLCYVAGLLLQLVVYWQFYGHVQTTYATAYDVLLQMPAQQPIPQPMPQNLPWDDQYQNEE